MLRFIVIVCLLLNSSLVMAQGNLKVGIYDNAPKIFLDTQNKPSGFFVDLLNAIAHEADWNIEYIPCQWAECLSLLEKGKIDIMPDVAYSDERKKHFDFNAEVVISSWSMVYTTEGNTILSLLDLDHKRIAVLKNSIQFEYLKEQATLFNIHPHFIEVEEFYDALGLLNAKKVDAAIINNFYNIRSAKMPNIQRTNVFLSPVILKFAFPKEDPAPHKAIIDKYLRLYKETPNSPFYVAKKTWLEHQEEKKLPLWVIWVIGIGASLIFLSLGVIFFFRKLLNQKINELNESQKILLTQSRSAAMGEMISMIAHQWKQPLATLSMISNNLKADMELGIMNTELVNDYHQQLSKQIFYLSHTIDDFRNFFKPIKEKESVKELHFILENALALMGKTLENHYISLTKEYGHTDELFIYSRELTQVILNLLKNAQEAFVQNPIRNPRIILRTYQKEEMVCIEIEDNAGGINEALREKIFDPYFTTKEVYNGSGLGLYISKAIIEKHFFGTLSFTCKGKNTIFTIKFPIKHAKVNNE